MSVQARIELMRKAIKSHREKLGLKQKEICKKLGMSPSTYSEIESGTRNRDISIDEIVRLCELFCISPNELMEWSE